MNWIVLDTRIGFVEQSPLYASLYVVAVSGSQCGGNTETLFTLHKIESYALRWGYTEIYPRQGTCYIDIELIAAFHKTGDHHQSLAS